MKYLILSLLFICCDILNAPFEPSIEGYWSEDNFSYTFLPDGSFKSYLNGVAVSREGLYETENDTLFMSYTDYFLGWRENSIYVHFKFEGDTLFIQGHQYIRHTNPRNLGDCKTYTDTIHVIDKYFYNKNGNKKPPCSSSPDYCGCMEARGITLTL